MNFFLRSFLIFFCTFHTVYCNEALMRDLMMVSFWDCYLSQRYPVMYNNLLQGGYLNMPSARMGNEGELGVGYAYVSPYNIYSARAQLTSWLETTLNYRVFIGVKDNILSQYGFGDFSDKGANLKIALIKPEDSDYRLPGFAIGFEDFMGTKAFNSEYLVLTKIHCDLNLEWSFGVGADRIKGWFGGVSLMPFLKSGINFLRPLTLVAEYDATDYRRDPHPKGRKQNNKINFGAKYRLFDQIDFSVSYLRGKHLSASVSAFYNFGSTKGLVPKMKDCLPYKAPLNLERIGPLRPPEVMSQDFYFAMKEQGFELLKVSLGHDACGNKIMRMVVYNEKYRLLRDVKHRLNHLLAYLTPMDVDKVIIVQESEGFPIQEFHYPMECLRRGHVEWMGNPEIDIVVPMRNPGCKPPSKEVIFSKYLDPINIEVLPKTTTLFGSARGKLKYALGINAGVDGFLWGNIYYSFFLGSIFFTDLSDVSSVDRLNPSQLINVHTEVIEYIKQKGITFDEFYLQKNSHLGKGWFSKVSLGYFQQMYGGIAGEVLYYPVSNRNWAVGVEGAVLKRRSKKGLGFVNTIQKLDGFVKTEVPFTGSQYFLNLYCEFSSLNIECKMKAGKFLANDWGARFELSRFFPSGFRMTVWYTFTNGNDRINGKQYFDKGIELSMPLDIFYTRTDRRLWHYGLAAWLRDVGYYAYTGRSLYNMINDQRQW